MGRSTAPYGDDDGASTGVDTSHTVGAVPDAVRSARAFSRIALFSGYHLSLSVRLSISIGDRCYSHRAQTASNTVVTNSLEINCGGQCHLQTSNNLIMETTKDYSLENEYYRFTRSRKQRATEIVAKFILKVADVCEMRELCLM